MRKGLTAGAILLAATMSLAAVAQAQEEEKILNVYNWFEALDPETVPNFEKETGIKVNYDTYEANETLEAKLLAGNSGYDLVFPSYFFMERQIGAGIYQPLDKSKLTNYGNLDGELMAIMANHDPDNSHAVPQQWGTTSLGYNVNMIKERMPDAPLDSYDLIFDPEIVSKFADCGVVMVDAPGEIMAIALNYLGKDPNSEAPEDLEAATELLKGVRPYIKYFSGSQHMNDLANGDICLGIMWNPDVFFAQMSADEAGQGVELALSIPKEGTLLWIDSALIPADAKHPENAHLFINYLLRPDVAAAMTNYVPAASPNAASVELVDEAIKSNGAIFLSDDEKSRLFTVKAHTPKYDRRLTRAWTEVRTGNLTRTARRPAGA